MTREECKILEEKANRLLEIKNIISEFEKEAKSYEAEIKAIIGNSEEVVYAGERRVSLKSESRVMVDSKKLKEEMADVFEAYSKVSSYRKLLVK